jgi:glycosyltransferase involved in cell wall biosynthesis
MIGHGRRGDLRTSQMNGHVEVLVQDVTSLARQKGVDVSELSTSDFRELPPYYRAAEIGVWPTQESMSMLDAAACALPIIVNDTLIARERIEGNGITYRLNDADDLAEKIRWLSDPDRRRELGSTGARRMVELFSWGAIARRRLADYEAAVAARRRGA